MRTFLCGLTKRHIPLKMRQKSLSEAGTEPGFIKKLGGRPGDILSAPSFVTLLLSVGPIRAGGQDRVDADT